jgi:putative addiction module component (TIGR02574 family)
VEYLFANPPTTLPRIREHFPESNGYNHNVLREEFMTTFSEILNAALALPPQQRDKLAAILHESAAESQPTGGSVSVSDAWRQELARRTAEIDAGTATYVTYEQMRERARRAAGHDG